MHYQVTVDIEAPADAVWAVLADVRRWPEWNSAVRRVRPLDAGAFDLGSRVRISQPRLPPAVWRVTSFTPGRSFAWTSRVPGITSVADHHITPGPRGRSATVTLTLLQDGPLAGLLAALTGRRSRRYVDTEALGLKQRCESLATRPPGKRGHRRS
jgi:uncharacterized membrane protein